VPVLTAFSVTLIPRKLWTNSNAGYNYSNGAYERLSFDKAMLWSRWLQKNQGEAVIITEKTS
jgi:hypothetical protein